MDPLTAVSLTWAVVATATTAALLIAHVHTRRATGTPPRPRRQLWRVTTRVDPANPRKIQVCLFRTGGWEDDLYTASNERTVIVDTVAIAETDWTEQLATAEHTARDRAATLNTLG